MHYKQFQNSVYKSLSGSDVKSQTTCFGHTIVETVEGPVLVDNALTLFCSLEEAVNKIKQQKLQENIQKQIQNEIYEDISNNKIADIIKKYHEDVKVTDTLIESYVDLASSKFFTVNPVAHEIRSINKINEVAQGRLDYKLDDDSVVVITEDTYNVINNIFGEHDDVISYMRQSADNFMAVVDQIGDQ